MFMMYVLAKFHIPNFNISLVTANKDKIVPVLQ
jgi:hypothetical protein